MTTAVIDKDAELRKQFLHQEVTKDSPHNVSMGVQRMEQQIQSWRDRYWKGIEHRLRKEHSLRLLYEPIWVAQGSAIFWQKPNYLYKAPLASESKWAPTGALPANTPSVIARYLEKGLRLRPPDVGVDVEPCDPESALPSDAVQPVIGEEELPVLYSCKRHGSSQYRFKSWSTYTIHCSSKRELLEYNPPVQEQKKALKFEYYCHLHGKGFNNIGSLVEHIKMKARQGIPHPEILDMKRASKKVSK